MGKRLAVHIVLDMFLHLIAPELCGKPCRDGTQLLMAGPRLRNFTPGRRFGQFGGEEFGLLLPETDTDEALERIRIADHPELRPSASFGMAPFS